MGVQTLMPWVANAGWADGSGWGGGLLGQAAERSQAGVAEDLVLWILQSFHHVSAFNKPLVGSYTWAFLATQLSVLLLVLVVHLVAFALLRRHHRQGRVSPETASWTALIVRALSAPAYLALWVYGLYFALVPFYLLPGASSAAEGFRSFLLQAVKLGFFACVFWMFFRLTWVVESALKRWTGKSDNRLDDLLVPSIGKSLRVIIPVLGIILALPLAGLPDEYDAVVRKLSSLLIILTVAWIFFQAVDVLEGVVLSRYDIDAADNLQARRIYTQVHVLKRTLYVVIGIVTVASAMMLFEEVRRLGTSILASAGVAGIILGFAAQRSIANVFAGLQIAISQPIRIDDVVIVEGEWGRIEEINLTYIVVRIWDLRRLVVPLSHFIEKPFQNWTRTSAEILGTVFLYTDYTVPVDAVREELKRIVEQSPHWDRQVCGLQVTNTSERTMELRALAGAADASKAWNLRCEIREKLITFLQTKYPGCLPRLRVAWERGDGRDTGEESPAPASPGDVIKSG